jgi:hypothetical protein
MKPTEVMRYAEMHEAVGLYTELERTSMGIFLEYSAIGSDRVQGVETVQKKKDRLLLLQQYLGIQRHLADQFAEALEAAKKAE